MTGIELPDIDLDGRVVIMTGADRGLGRAMSLGLAEKGARMVLASPAVDGLEGLSGPLQAPRNPKAAGSTLARARI